jgi:hypothetical protein
VKFSSLTLQCDVVDNNGLFLDVFDCGVDFEYQELINHYNDFLALKRDEIIDKILK